MSAREKAIETIAREMGVVYDGCCGDAGPPEYYRPFAEKLLDEIIAAGFVEFENDLIDRVHAADRERLQAARAYSDAAGASHAMMEAREQLRFHNDASEYARRRLADAILDRRPVCVVDDTKTITIDGAYLTRVENSFDGTVRQHGPDAYRPVPDGMLCGSLTIQTFADLTITEALRMHQARESRVPVRLTISFPKAGAG